MASLGAQGAVFLCPSKPSIIAAGAVRNEYRWHSQKTAAGTIAAAVAVEEGRLELETLRVPFAGEKATAVSSHPAAAAVERGELVLRFKPVVQLADFDCLSGP
ncbi:MAG TPA: hypothetical protein VN893_11825 [Bryobacteraceae bacterium]|jgi:hypothetical protein|nr:hypothetical protein [Bryobacteraceae bacterium]